MTARKTRVLFNTFAGVGVQLLSMIISFAITPVLLHALGSDQFGLYAIVASCTAYFGMLDFGIGAGLVRYLAFYSERGEQGRVKQILTFSLLFYLGLGIVFAPLVIFLAPGFAELLHLQGSLAHMGTILLPTMFCLFILSSMVSTFQARLISLHRMDIASYAGLIGQICYAIIIVFFVDKFPNLYLVIAASFGQIIISSGICYFVANRMAPGFLSDPRRIESGLVRSLFGFGGWSQICALSSIVNMEADKFIVGHYLGVSTVTPYQVGNKLALLNRSFPLQLLSALLPDLTAAFSRGASDHELMAIYAKTTRYLMIATLMITGFVTATADLLVKAWMGSELPMAGFLASGLAISYAVNNLTGIGTVIMKAKGLIKYETYYAVVGMVLNIFFTILFTPRYGIYGTVGATIIGNTLGSIFFMFLFHRVTKFPWWMTIGRWLVPLASMVSVTTLIIHYALTAIPEVWLQTRFPEAIALFISGIAFLVILIITLWGLNFWKENDLILLERFTKKLGRGKTAR